MLRVASCQFFAKFQLFWIREKSFSFLLPTLIFTKRWVWRLQVISFHQVFNVLFCELVSMKYARRWFTCTSSLWDFIKSKSCRSQYFYWRVAARLFEVECTSHEMSYYWLSPGWPCTLRNMHVHVHATGWRALRSGRWNVTKRCRVQFSFPTETFWEDLMLMLGVMHNHVVCGIFCENLEISYYIHALVFPTSEHCPPTVTCSKLQPFSTDWDITSLTFAISWYRAIHCSNRFLSLRLKRPSTPLLLTLAQSLLCGLVTSRVRLRSSRLLRSSARQPIARLKLTRYRHWTPRWAELTARRDNSTSHFELLISADRVTATRGQVHEQDHA